MRPHLATTRRSIKSLAALLKIKKKPIFHSDMQKKLSKNLPKRIFDFILTIFFFLIGHPFWICIPLMIKLTSKGPVFYKSCRVGLGGGVV